MHDPIEPIPGTMSKQRMEALSDGLYAIALTLLVLDLKVPALPHGAGNEQLLAALHDILPKALTWLLSFWVMGILWSAQARTYRFLHSLTPAMLRLELLLLASVSLMPFTTGLVSEYGTFPAAAALYAGNLFAISVFSELRTTLLLRDARLHASPIDAALRKRMRNRAVVLLACTTATLVLAFFVPPYNMFAMLPMLLRVGESRA